MLNRTLCIDLVLGVILAAPCGFAAAAVPTVEELASVLSRYNAVSETDLPTLSKEQLATLMLGDMVDVRERTPIKDWRGKSQDKIRVIGYQLVERPRLLVWLASLNVTTQHNKRLTEHLIETNDAGASVWYQHLDTPWPVRNRHWVISNDKNTRIAEATLGLVWEHKWQLTEHGHDIALNLLMSEEVEGLDKKKAESTIYLTFNRGAWTMFSVNNEVTLVAAHTTADMGGWIPDSWVAKFVSRQLSGVLKNLTTKADTAHIDYTGDQPVFSGVGIPISAGEAADVQRQFHLNQKLATGTTSFESRHN